MSTRKMSRSSSPRPVRTMADLKALPVVCANCGFPVQAAALYCSQLCSQEAEWVRYVRACCLDGRVERPDVIEAIKIRLAHLLAGGYDKLKRKLPDALRQAIIARDKGRCQICGQPGDEIDHIGGGSNDPKNLQLLCDECHNRKTRASMVTLTNESHPEAWENAQRLKQRANSRQPIQFCDSLEWGGAWRRLLSDRRRLVKEEA